MVSPEIVTLSVLRTPCTNPIDIHDAIATLGFLFLGDPSRIDCHDAADTNDTGDLDLSDPIYLLNYLFLGGPAPEAPFPSCGPDPTEDELTCSAFESCTEAE